jgi:hypothetical protein
VSADSAVAESLIYEETLDAENGALTAVIHLQVSKHNGFLTVRGSDFIVAFMTVKESDFIRFANILNIGVPVSSNGYTVSMNPQSWEGFQRRPSAIWDD